MNKVERLKNIVKKFRDERDWKQFHNPKDLSQALSIETSELLELFLWVTQEDSYIIIKEKKEDVSDEMADIFAYLLAFSNVTSINLEAGLSNHKQFDNPKDLSIVLNIKAAKLSEYFLWISKEESYCVVNEKIEAITNVITNIYTYLSVFAEMTGIDLETALLNKIEKNKKKYPVDKVKGSSKKYTEYNK